MFEYPTFEYKDADGYYYNGIHLPEIVYIIDNTMSLLNHDSLDNMRELFGDNFVNRVKGRYIIIIQNNND
jgi:capsid portal protein